MSAATGDGPAASAAVADHSARERVVHDVGSTMFVEAGAGTGKTTALVGRIVELVSGEYAVPISAIAAITFTEKAAAELRNRIRAELNARLAGSQDARTCQQLRDALDGLDSAAISTLHSFARRILSEHPIEAGLPPLFETLDQITSDVEFDDRWRSFVNELLADDDALWLVQMLDAAGVTPADLREMGAAFGANWDRIRPPDRPFEPAPLQIDGLVARGSALCARGRECSDPADKALARFGQLEEFVARLRWARSDAEALGVLLDAEDSRHGVPKIGTRRRGTGQAQNWKDIASVREDFTALRVLCTETAAEALRQVISAWCSHVACFTIEAAEQRRASGRLEFHDLLVRARDLLKSSDDARDSLHRRYRHLLLDEFQDTDPIQIEIAARIAAVVDVDETVPDGWQHIDIVDGQLFFVGDPKQSIYRFRRADISLYLDARDRFANSQPAAALVTNFRTTEPIIDWVNHTFDRLMAARGTDPADQLAPAAHDGGAEPPTAAGTAPERSERLHPEYAPLHASRSAVGQGPAVVALSLSGHGDLSAQGIRDAEAADIAGVITEILANQWSVEDRHRGGERPARLGDIAILIPTRTCLPQLEAGLTAAQVPYRLDASEFVWRSRTVRDLLMCLRAVADPDDALAVVSALRTPLYGCGDDDLYTYYRAAGSWSIFASDFSAVPDGAEHPVAAGMQHLRRLYDEHAVVAPSVLLDRLVRQRRVLEQAAAGQRTREVWRHVRYVIDQARAWSHSQHGGLRQFLRWAAMQASERAKVTEAILPESDDDSVRVMTVHAAKGLEFPIVIVAGLQGGNRSRPSLVGFTGADHDGPEHCCGAAAVRLRAGAETAGYALWAEREKAADHFERIRLLYVACTRARDHLIVSLHRPLPPANADTAQQPRSKPSSQLLFEAMPKLDAGTVASARGWDYREAPGDATVARQAADTAASRSGLPERGDWLARRERAVRSTQTRSALSATFIAHRGAAAVGDAEHHQVGSRASPRGGSPPARGPGDIGPIDDGLNTDSVDARHAGKDAPDEHLGDEGPPARRGRGATAVGKAVHGVLQAVDLADGEALDELAAAQAVVEGVANRADEVADYVRSALASDEVQCAAAGRCWREVYVAAPATPTASSSGAASGPVVEGYIDLLFEDDQSDGLVVVDYKTDALGAMPGADHERAEQYRRQVTVYAWCLERATGLPVARVVLLYLRADGTPAHADALGGEALRQAIDDVAGLAADLAQAPEEPTS